MTLDTDNIAYLDAMAAASGPDAPPLWELPIPVLRQAVTGGRAPLGSGPAMERTQELSIPTGDGATIRGRLHVPTTAPLATLVYLHGGGWVIEDIDGFDVVARELAARSGAAVVLVDYRKAPEHPFPTPLDDAGAALAWVAAHADELGIGGLPLVVGGDSAGGNLAAVTARRARDVGGPVLAGQLLVYPVIDDDRTRPSYTRPENDNFLSPTLMGWFWDQYVPDPAGRAQPDTSPLAADSLAGLPPALVLTAGGDILTDGVDAYAEALRAADVPVEARRFDGQIHSFFSVPSALPSATAAHDLVGDWIRRTIA